MADSPYHNLRDIEQPKDEDVLEMGREWLFLSAQLGMCLRHCGWDLRGFSINLSRDKTLLTVRLVGNDLPQVVFVAGKSPSHCVATLMRQYKAGTLTFHLDKYA